MWLHIFHSSKEYRKLIYIFFSEKIKKLFKQIRMVNLKARPYAIFKFIHFKSGIKGLGIREFKSNNASLN